MSLFDNLAANKRFEFTSKAFDDAQKFAVVNLHGKEAISQMFRFELTLVSADADIDFGDMLQKPASLLIYPADGSTATPYHGVLSAFDQLHKADGYVFYRAVLVPRLWRLSLYRITDLYVGDQVTPELLKLVLDKGRIFSDDRNFVTSGVYDKRDYVTQYEETYLAFLSRWMERDGLYYYFSHDKNKDILNVADGINSHAATTVEASYRPADRLDTGGSNKAVQSFVGGQRPLPNKVILQDYNYTAADVALRFEETVSASGIGDVMLQNENIRTEAEGKRYAKLRAQELICASRHYYGESTVVGLRSGFFLTLAQHYRSSFNGKYLVTEIEHRGSQAGALLNGMSTPFNEDMNADTPATYYANSFQAIPADVQFRAQRVTPWPYRQGTMSATIDSSKTDNYYADLDDKGRYLVKLRFTQSASADANKVRIRMASPYAGTVKVDDKAVGYGMHTPLHKGAEVLLSFEGGDPDRPVILGAVANSLNPNVTVGPDDNKVVSRLITPGNSIVIDDTKGSESITLKSASSGTATIIGKQPAAAVKGIWQSTSGSSFSLSGGNSTSISVGVKNSLGLSLENSATASVTTKAAVGASFGVSYGRDVAWKFGKSFSVDDSTSVSFKTDGKLQANETVTISGGQRVVIKTAVEALKTAVKTAVIVNTVANMVVAGGAAAASAKLSDSASGKLAFDSLESGALTAGQTAANGLIIGITQFVLDKAATAIETVCKDVTYASNIKVNNSGINIKADQLLPPGLGEIDVKHNSIKLGVAGTAPPGNSHLDITGSKISVVGAGLPALQSALDLDATQAQLSTANPVGKVALQTPAGGRLTASASGLVAQANAAGLSELNLSATGATLEYSTTKGFAAKPLAVSATYMKAEMKLSSMAAELSYGSSSLTVSPAGAKVNGMMIQLG
ncbi:type VI secretion system secreted protein VgrG [Herbaspirillum sp. 1173]|uniref:type VI secretion system Vgr family protein n=1 Tax=Herbaspirillum sp. 1173 TaxID=2817734 RepID=UPI00285BF693|nr:type VI secretion system tip protein TssI/VgrG [Herbaspirillum sp. 1173]MDR6739161.1 type VI secretion system secreted protein VgrG [Herbaspirillum sp. 1173]